MSKFTKRLSVLVTTAVLSTSMLLGGCGLVGVNTERDGKQVIAEIGDTKVEKSVLNNYLAYHEISVAAGGQAMPKGKELKTLKKSVLKSIVEGKTFAKKAADDKEKADEKAAATQADMLLSNIKQNGGDFAKILSKYNSNEEEFKAFFSGLILDNELGNKALTKYIDTLKKDPKKVTSAVIGKIGDEEIKKGEYNYYYIYYSLTNYSMTGKGLETDEESVKATNKEIFNMMAQKRALAKYAEENKITVTDKEIGANQEQKQATIKSMLPTDEEKKKFLDNYFLSKDEFNKFQKEDAKTAAITTKIMEKLTEEAEVKDSEVAKYFKEHEASYNASTASAMHILTENENLAKEIFEKTKGITKKEAFDKVMTEYKSNPEVREAADLGSFKAETMVKEFSDAAFGAKVNTTVGPVKTQFGYHVIYVYDKVEGGKIKLEDKKDEITKILKTQNASTKYKDVLKKATDKFKQELGDIKEPRDIYLDQLEKEYNVKIFEKVI